MSLPNTATPAFNPRSTETLAFDAAFAARATKAVVRAETADDSAFLERLFMECSRYASLLPPAMLQHQATLQNDSHRRNFPSAMRRILCVDGAPIGHIVIEWGAEGPTSCVDIAILPDHTGTGLGRHLLEAWLEVADQHGRQAELTVSRDNPASRLYARLGFVAAPDDDLDSPHATLQRRPTVPPR